MSNVTYRQKNPAATLGYTSVNVDEEHPLPVEFADEVGVGDGPHQLKGFWWGTEAELAALTREDGVLYVTVA